MNQVYYSFLDQGVGRLKQSLDSILTNSIKTLEMDASFDEPDIVTSSGSSGFLHMVNTTSDNSKLQLAPSIKSLKLWCQARVLLLTALEVSKMWTSKLICYFPVIQWHLASDFHHWITSFWILLISRQIRLFHTLRLTCVQLLMPL